MAHGGFTQHQINVLRQSIGLRLKQIYREHKGSKLTQGEVAEKAGISQGTFSDLIAGKSAPRAETLICLYRSMRVSPLWVLTGEGAAFAD